MVGERVKDTKNIFFVYFDNLIRFCISRRSNANKEDPVISHAQHECVKCFKAFMNNTVSNENCTNTSMLLLINRIIILLFRCILVWFVRNNRKSRCSSCSRSILDDQQYSGNDRCYKTFSRLIFVQFGNRRCI